MNTFVSVKDLNDSSETIFQNSQYRDLIQLIKYQREKINSQQVDLTKVIIQESLLTTNCAWGRQNRMKLKWEDHVEMGRILNWE